MSQMEMRQVYVDTIREMMAEDARIVLLNADLGKAGGTLGLAKLYPDRVFDVGVAEANMLSIAAGMASYGLRPWVATFAPFATRRACDQFALSICYARQNVKVIGMDPGIAAELNGGTHMGLEDVAATRSYKGLTIFEPVDARQLKQALPQLHAHQGPAYIRLFRKAIADVFPEGYRFELGRADVVKEGRDVSLFASGLMVQECVEALPLLEAAGISAELVNIHTIKPIDREAILRSARKTGCVVTAENHSVIGGLYSAVAETLASGCPVPALPIGINDMFGEVGFLPYLKKRFHMTKEDILAACRESIRKKEEFK